MLTLHVEADSYDKLVKDCWAALGLELRGQRPAVPETSKDTPNGQTEKKPVGRPKKEAVAEPMQPAPVVAADPFPTLTPTPTPAPAPAPSGTISLEQVRGALQAYADKMSGGKDGNIGIVKAREVLAKFTSVKGVPCQKISEVQDTDYAKVLAVCAA